MTPQDCASIITIIGAIGTFVVGIAALVVSCVSLRTQCQALRAQREALPVSVEFGFKESGFVDSDGVRWVMAWMQNRGVTVYVRELYRYEWEPLALRDEQLPDVARVVEPGSMPEFLRSKSRATEKSWRVRTWISSPGAELNVLCFLPSWRRAGKTRRDDERQAARRGSIHLQ